MQARAQVCSNDKMVATSTSMTHPAYVMYRPELANVQSSRRMEFMAGWADTGQGLAEPRVFFAGYATPH